MNTEVIISAITMGLGGLLVWFFKSTLSDVTKRLDRLEHGLSALLSELRAGNITATTNTQEINLLRARMHELSNDVHLVKITQQNCKKCSGRE